MKIVELLVSDFDNLELGVEGIALVDRPAHESNWQMFEEVKNPFLLLDDILSEEEQIELARILALKGQDEKDLLDEGYVLVGMEPLSLQQMFTEFDINGVKIYSAPNGKSSEDSLGSRQKRYKYVGPRDSKNRRFCAAMMSANKIYRIEDIQEMTDKMSNAEFGYYNIFQYRGSYNCRHQWVVLYYEPTANILNDAKRRRGLADVQSIPQEPTITRATAEAQAKRNETTNVALGVIDVIDGLPLFDSKEQAEMLAEKIGCSGSHIHELEDGSIGYMPCEQHTFEESYNDYPEGVKDTAQRALNWVEKNGWGGCGTDVGKQRAHQLANGENISESTIKRMYGFLSRHKGQGADKGKYGDGCGRLMYDAWGGDAALSWSERKINQIEKEKMSISISGIGDDLGCGCMNYDIQAPTYTDQISGKTISEEEMLYDNPCQPGYEAIGLKDKNGRRVPNCVPIQNSKLEFSYDEEKKEVVGAALIPNKMIIRRDPMSGELFYVYFSEDTIRGLSEKFMRDKLLDSTNLDHTSIKADSYVAESWLIEDPLMDKSTALGFSLPKGTWMIKMKIASDKLWEEIKNKKYNGFSVEGMFQEKLVFNNIKY